MAEPDRVRFETDPARQVSIPLPDFLTITREMLEAMGRRWGLPASLCEGDFRTAIVAGTAFGPDDVKPDHVVGG